MMEEITFNYKPMPNSSSKNLYPLAEVDLEYQGKRRTIWPIIDSGASLSICSEKITPYGMKWSVE